MSGYSSYLKFSYCFSKHRRYWDIFMVWRFQVKEIGETEALPLTFLCIFTICLLKAAHICSVQPLENCRRYHCVMKAMALFQWITLTLDVNLYSDISAGYFFVYACCVYVVSLHLKGMRCTWSVSIAWKSNHSVLEVFKQISTAWTTLLKVSKYNENDSQMQYWEKCNNKAS